MYYLDTNICIYFINGKYQSLKNKILSILNYVLLMSVNPGFGGQKFIPEMLEKIEELAKLREEKNYNSA